MHKGRRASVLACTHRGLPNQRTLLRACGLDQVQRASGLECLAHAVRTARVEQLWLRGDLMILPLKGQGRDELVAPRLFLDLELSQHARKVAMTGGR